MSRWIVVALALVVGSLLFVYDGRTDDTGIEVGLLVGCSLVFAAIAPRAWWMIALAVGLPIAALSGLVEGHSAAIVALVFSSLGAVIGSMMRRAAVVSRPG